MRLIITETVKNVSFNVSVGIRTAVDWFNKYRQTIGKALDYEFRFVRIPKRPVEVNEAK